MPTPSPKSSRPLSMRATKSTAGSKLSKDLEMETMEEPMPSESKSKYIEPVRFSVRRDLETEGGSMGRIILYVVVVVVIGVGLVLLIQNFASNQNTNSDSTNSSTTSSLENLSPNLQISRLVQSDSEVSNVTPLDAYTTADSALGSSANDVAAVTLETLAYQAYNTFSRTSFKLAGVVDSKLPATSVKYSNVDKTLTVTFSGINVSDQALLADIAVNAGNLVRIVGEKTGNDLTYTLYFVEGGKYYVFVQDGNSLVIDYKTNTELSEPTSSVSSSAVSSVSTSSAASSVASSASSSAQAGVPSAPHYDNDASQNKQYVVSAVTGNGLYSETYYYIDYGDSFQFSWAMRNEGEIPNASAELITDSGKNYIEVKINNLGYELLHAMGRSEAVISIPTTSSNLVAVKTKGYSNGTATFWVELRQAGEFRLHSTQTYQGHQLLSIQVMD